MESSENGLQLLGQLFPTSEVKIKCESGVSELEEVSKITSVNGIFSVKQDENATALKAYGTTLYNENPTFNGCSTHNKSLKQLFKNVGDLKTVNGLNQINEVRHHVEESIRPESHNIIKEVLERVGQLTPVEKLLLYLKLPTGKEPTDPLKLPLNPLGSRSEISQTIAWIKTHLQEDQDVSLPKQDVYDQYMAYCDGNNIKPLSTADFGKVMKQVLPGVRPRRLGTRGNSRYCYAGLCKQNHLPSPVLPNLSLSGNVSADHVECGGDRLENRSWSSSCPEDSISIVCRWAERLLNKRFSGLSQLASHINAIGSKDSFHSSTTADGTAGLNSMGNEKSETKSELLKKRKNQESIVMTSPDLSKFKKSKSNCGKTGNSQPKHPPMERTNGVKQKRSSTIYQSEVICDSLIKGINNDRANVMKNQGIANDLKMQSTMGADLLKTEFSLKLEDTKKGNVNGCIEVRRKSEPTLRGNERNIDTVKSISTFYPELKLGKLISEDSQPMGSLQSILNKVQIPRLPTKSIGSVGVPKNIIIIPQNLVQQSKSKSSKPVQPKLDVELAEESAFRKPVIDKRGDVHYLNKDEKPCVKSSSEMIVGSLEKDALDDYLHGDGNSQEQEEELLKYFQPHSPNRTVRNTAEEPEMKSEQLSQLRSLLEKNLCYSRPKFQPFEPTDRLNSVDQAVSSTVLDEQKGQEFMPGQLQSAAAGLLLLSQKSQTPNLLSPSSSSLNLRRRVSFETNAQDSVPQSPNTRRQVFNFTPISPRPYSPSGKAMSSSASGSPFLSPRDTPLNRKCSSVFNPVPQTIPVSAPVLANLAAMIRARSARYHASVNNPLSPTNIVPTSESNCLISSLLDCKKDVNDGVFILPNSPTCDSPVLTFQNKSAVPSSKAEESHDNTNSMPSLLQTILLSKKMDYKELNIHKEEDTLSPKANQDPLSQEVSQFFSDDTQLPIFDLPTIRSHSVPMISSGALISPLSTTQPFPYYTQMSVAPTPVPSELVDFGGINTESSSSTFFLMTDTTSPESNQLLMETEINSDNLNQIFDLITENSGPKSLLLDELNKSALQKLNEGALMEMDGSEKSFIEISKDSDLEMSQISKALDLSLLPSGMADKSFQFSSRFGESRSYPNTPLVYSNNLRDPIVSAFVPKPPVPAIKGGIQSQSYPSTPVPSFSETAMPLCTARRNINAMLENPSTTPPLNLLIEEDDLAMQALPDCEDTFNDLAKEVNTEQNVDISIRL